jgi:uncharacterized RDD family membrane protein YckC
MPKLFAILILAITFATAASARALPRDLLAAASDEAVVLAHIQPPDKTDPDATAEQTLILSRRLGKETHWRKLATLGQRVVSIAACGEDAKVLLDSGDWMTVWDDGQAFGPPAPGVQFIALAADHEKLWAIGRPAPAATQPTTEAADLASTTNASTQPAWPRTPAVYRFDEQHWTRVMALPPEIDPTASTAAFSFAIIESQPVLATSNGGNGIRVWTAQGDGQDDRWLPPHDLPPATPIISFDILADGLPPTIWLTQGGAGFLANIAGDQPLSPDGAAATEPRSAARAAEAIRLFSASGDQLYEQAYSTDGTPMGKRAQLVIDLMGPESEIQNWLAPALTVIITMLLFGAARRGGLPETPPAVAQANLSLAPLFPRFAAGAIDAIPVLLSILYVARQMSLAGTVDGIPTNDQMIPFYIGSGIYLLYTITTELIFGRTLGKWLFGLQIITLEGTRPSRPTLLLRNALRIIDLVLIWLPLAMVLFSPLRQRVGDLVAGTLVVQPTPPQTPEPPTP